MTTRRTMVWLVLFLVTVPTVVAAADAVDRAQRDAVFVEMPYLREGETYVYDLHFSSESRKMGSSVSGFLKIDVGHVTRHGLLDGTSVEVLPVTTTTENPPWVEAEAESVRTVKVAYLRPSDGQLVASEARESTVDYRRTDDGDVRRVELEMVTQRQIDDPNYGLTANYRPGQRYTNANEVTHAILAISGLAEGYRLAGEGTFRGETVYQTDVGWSTSQNSGSVGCSLYHPRVSYTDAFESRTGREGPFFGKERSDVWISTRHAFPVVSTCDATFTDGAGTHVDHITLSLVLADHVPGGREVRFAKERLPLEVAPALPTQAMRLPGLPAQGGLDLLFPMEEAVQILLKAPELASFRSTGDIPFFVTGFEHVPFAPTRRTVDLDPVSPVPDPLGLVPPEAHGDAPRHDAVWEIRLQNLEGKRMTAVLDRAYDAAGDVVDEERTFEKVGGTSKTQLDDLPLALPSLQALAARHAALMGTTLEAWLKDPGASISSSSGLSTHTRNEVVTRELHLQISFSGSSYDEATEEWYGTTGSYDLRTGGPRTAARYKMDAEDVPAQPAGRVPPALQAVSVVPDSHLPAAATASGLAVALAFVAAYFWDGISRVVIAPFYAKIRKDKLLDHRTRDQIVEYVEVNPGATLGAVRLHISSGYGTAVHHLNTLEHNGLVVSRKVGRERCYFPAGRLSPVQMDAVAASGTDAARRFLQAITTEPGLTQQELAARLGVSDTAVRYQVNRLLDHEMVRVERDGRSVRHFPARSP